MRNTSYLIDLACPSCGKSYNPTQPQTICTTCNSPLFANYDLVNLRNVIDRNKFRHRQKGMWRWSELLPVNELRHIITLGEGDTPLLNLKNIGAQIGLQKLFLKEEGQNPTGSFKARGISAAISKAAELGIHKIVIPSAGNAGGALAAYAARGNISSCIYMPKSTPIANVFECTLAGAKVEQVDGLINLAGKFAQDASEKFGWFNMATFKEPYRVEGKKIMGYEIAESFNWKLPDIIIYPTGGGTGLVGMWKAFLEMDTLGWLEDHKKPKMVAVQSEGCAPIIKAFNSGQMKSEMWEGAHTIASGLCVPHSFADQLILRYIRDSHGIAIAVSDHEILESRQILAQREGILACPEGAATLAGLNKLLHQGFVHPEDTIIIFNTGSGLKYIEND